MLVAQTGSKSVIFYSLIMMSMISFGKASSHVAYELYTGKEFNDAFANPEDNPKLPNVLIIGDSISIGYTIEVRKLLKGKANVYRIPTNGQHTGFGVENIEKWLGKRKWDLIHFNFGIWDTHYLYCNTNEIVKIRKPSNEQLKNMHLRYTTEQYVNNLKKILITLKASKAKLIWASSTPVTNWSDKQKEYQIEKNKEAIILMKKEKILINDLDKFVLSHLKVWQSKDGCHFTKQGYKELAKKVASVISDELNKLKKNEHKVLNSN